MKIEEDGVLNSYEITKEDLKRITAKAGEYADKIDWAKVRESVREHSGVPVAVLDKNRKPSRGGQGELENLMEQTGAKEKDLKISSSKEAEEKAGKKLTEDQQPASPHSSMSSRARTYNFND